MKFLIGSLFVVCAVSVACANASEETLERFLEKIVGGDLRTVEKALAALPVEMKQNYVLMYRSRSLQSATPKAPRAILFSRTGRFVLTFNGGSQAGGGDTLEALQFRDETQSFEFREISFPSGARARISDKNPKKCLSCHQGSSRSNVDPRPNWEPYAFWPGAYGSVDGSFAEDRVRKIIGLNPETDQEIIDDVLREPIRLRDFSRDVAPKHPRYKHLSNFDELAIFNLTNRLAELNFQRLARIIRQEREIRAVFSPLFEYQYRCANLSSLREVELIKWSLGQKVPSYPERPLPSQTEFNNLITRIFEPLGVGTSDWSMDFRTRGRFAARDRFGTPGSVESQFQSALYKVLPEVRSFQTRICADLLEVFKSRANQFMRDGTHLKLAARRSSDSNSDSKSDSN